MCPAHAKRSARAGSRVSMIRGLSMRPRIRAGLGVSAVFERFWPLALAGRARAAIDSVVSGGCGSSARSASCRLPSVADMPHTMSCGFQPDRRASASCTCTPRLLPSSSCHSSATTSCTDCSASRASARASSSDRLSGVVTSTVGKRRLCAARSPLAVSPVRSPLVQCGARSASGPRSARNVSAASARMGVSHSTVSGGALAGSAVASDSIAACAFLASAGGTKRIKAPSQTASVLPAPVVACSRPLRPSAMACQTSSWNGKGRWPRVASQSVARPKLASTRSGEMGEGRAMRHCQC